MNIPDDAIEAGREAVSRLIHEAPPYKILLHGEIARAALEAAMPAIREALAQEIEAADGKPWCNGMRDAARIVRGDT